MSVYISSDNKLVTCPYDEAHKVKESRLQLHIAKCKLNHLDLTKPVCPFNATHLLQQGEYDHHLINCPDRGSLDRQLSQTADKKNTNRGRLDLPKYSDPFYVDDNNLWDSAEQAVLELAPAPPGAVIEPPAMAKPAERRKLYKDLHQAPSGTERKEIGKISSPSPKPSSAPRQPKQPSETQMFQDAQQTNAQAVNSLGLGRGRPVSRIAAAIFPKANDGASELISYSSIVQNMSNLGLGRGQPVDKAPSPAYNDADDDDFPALGCGRGGLLAPKQNLRTPGAKPEK